MKILLKNIKALRSDNDGFKAEETSIAVEDGIIKYIGNVPADFTADEVIDGKNKLAIPGLINAHTHTYMSVFRNLADDVSFDEWLFKSVMPREDRMTPNDAYWGAMLSYIEMLRTGTTTCVDMHMFRGMCAKAADRIGIRTVLCRGLVGSSMDDPSAIARINDLKYEIANYSANPRFGFMVAPHAIYTAEHDLLCGLSDFAAENGLRLNIHLAETRGEFNTALEKYGMTPVQYLDEMGFFKAKTLAAHCVHLTDEDIDILAKRGVSVATCPKSNCKLGSGIAPLQKLLDSKVNVCIGTDSAASNNSLNLFGDMNYAAMLSKGTLERAQSISACDVLKFATVNGAKALGYDNLGTLDEGMAADIAVLDIDRPEFYPENDLVTSLVYSAYGNEVETVIVNGEIVMQNGEFKTIDEEYTIHMARETAAKLRNYKA